MGQGFITRRGKLDSENYVQVVNYTMLYHEGNEYTDVTGGWQYINIMSQYAASLSMTKQSGYLQCNQTGSGIGALTTKNSFDMGGYSKVRFVASAKFNSANWVNFSISFLSSTAKDANKRTKSLGKYSTVSKKEYLLDVTEIVDGTAWYPYIAFPSLHIDFTGYVYLYSMILFKSDMAYIHTLCENAGVTSTYASVDALVSDTDAISKILSSKKAVSAMVSLCTGDFMITAIQNSNFMTALASSEYKELVYANEHWAKFLAMVA